MPSSVIKSFDYDKTHARLRIVFTSGRVYDYVAVPPAVVDGLRDAPSKGVFFNAFIRRNFPYHERGPANTPLRPHDRKRAAR